MVIEKLICFRFSFVVVVVFVAKDDCTKEGLLYSVVVVVFVATDQCTNEFYFTE